MNRRSSIVALIVWALPAGLAGAAEPWADRDFPRINGPLLWLDAARQEAARSVHGLPAPSSGGRLAVWYDGSGNRLHLVQRAQDAQPRFLRHGKHPAVRFDGKGTHLGLTGLGRSVEKVTLFIVAAPRSNAGLFRALLACNETGKNDYT